MKNIHLLPTEKPSRLIIYSILLKNELRLLDIPIDDWNHKRHLYITSDEEPKNKDYYWDENKNKIKRYFERRESFPSLLHRFKIILTTNPDLIEDGVQAIDDEFLEWFVKNPGCEEVEVEKRYSDFTVNPFVGYKIIIPQEEYPMTECYFIPSKIPTSATICDNCGKEKSLHTIGEDIKASKSVIIRKEEPKHETLEEYAFRNGAEWQAKRMYSEEEVRELLLIQRGNSYVAILTKTKDKELAAIASTAPEPGGKDGWVKQFKNK